MIGGEKLVFARSHPLLNPYNGPMPRTLVIGATGNIGRHVVTQLLAQGATVRALARNPDTAALPPQAEVVRGDLTVEEMRIIKQTPVADTELRRAKDHLKGSVMLSLENTSSRMSHLARQEIYFDRQFSLDETLQGIERVTPEDILRVGKDLFSNGALAATVLGQNNGLQLPRERLSLN